MTLKRILIAFAVLAALVVGLLIYQLFGPAPAITVSPQTTFIVEPLGDDGLPDFGQAILARAREGLTPENNGALPFWRAMGPGDMSGEDFGRIANEIGLGQVDLSACLVAPYDASLQEALAGWMKEQRGAEEAANVDSDDVADVDEPYGAVERLWDFAMGAPWNAAQIPPLARWVEANQQPLDWLVEAGAKPRFYSPSPTLLRSDSQMLINVLLPGMQKIRDASRALSVRCMYQSGEGDYAAAWQDCLAIWRLGEHVAQEWSLVGKLVGIAVRGVARSATLAILNEPDLPPELAERILGDLLALGDRIDMADAMNFGERLAMLDIVIRTSGGQIDDLQFIAGLPEVNSMIHSVLIDADPILRRANEFYDQLYAAATLEEYDARTAALAKFDADVDAINFSPTPAAALGAVISRHRRSEVIGDVLLTLMLPAVSAASEASDRDEIGMTLARTAAALTVYRGRHGEYPETLEALTPELLPAVPIDLFIGKPLIYERRGEGYLLYSVGLNGTDEGGDNEWSSQIVDGEWIEEDQSEDSWEGRVSHREGDYVIRMPLQPVEMPEIQLTESAVDQPQ